MYDPKIKIAPEGPTFSRIVAGVWKWGNWGWNLEPAKIRELIEHCLEEGIDTFDHADIYGDYETEKDFGNALKTAPGLRDQIKIITKCGIKLVSENRPGNKLKSYDTSRDHIIESVETSLRALGTDHIDVLMIHRPDPLLQPEEVASAFTELRRSGKVLHFGVSNFTPAQFEVLNQEVRLVTNQVQASIIELSPFHNGTFDQCLKHKISPMAWSPLTGGRVFKEISDPTIQNIRKQAEEIGQRAGGFHLDQVLLAWLLKHPASILPVLGTARKERITDAVKSLKIEISREEWFELWEASAGHEVP